MSMDEEGQQDEIMQDPQLAKRAAQFEEFWKGFDYGNDEEILEAMQNHRSLKAIELDKIISESLQIIYGVSVALKRDIFEATKDIQSRKELAYYIHMNRNNITFEEFGSVYDVLKAIFRENTITSTIFLLRTTNEFWSQNSDTLVSLDDSYQKISNIS